MNEEKFLVHIDILGFEKLPRELGKNTDFNENWIRENAILNPFNKKIQDLENNNQNDSKKYYIEKGTDNCFIIASDLSLIFQILHKFLNIDLPTENKNIEKIPIEVAIDIIKNSEDSDNPIASNEIISALKKDLPKKYRDWHKEQFHESIKESYVILTAAVFQKLEVHQKIDCKKIPLENEVIFSLPISAIKREFEIYDFLKKIGKSRNDASGALIDKVFIPPQEYENILKSFEKDHIIFLTGTPEYGKTYLAIRLLWLWYKKGYNPIWIKGGDINERSEGRKFLETIDANKNQNQIIYVEDPFGNIEYEKREKLSQGINEIISFIQNKTNIFLLLTSRKDIFKEFKADSLSDEEIENFEKELNLKMPSYDTQKRKSILNDWANIKDCKWYKVPKLKKHVISLIEKEDILPTPLSIHNFIQNSINIQNIDDIEREIKRNSESSERNFAKEIIGLYNTGRKDKILLLSFILISENFDYKFINYKYDNLKKEGYQEFSKLVDEEDRIIVSNRGFTLPLTLPFSFSGQKILSFKHPSYRATTPFILKNSGCNLIFCKALGELSYDSKSIPDVIRVLNKYYLELPKKTRNELIQTIYQTHLKKKFENYSSNTSCEEDDYENYIEPYLELLISHYDELDQINQTIFRDLLNIEFSGEIILYLISQNYPNCSLKIKELFKNYIIPPKYLKGALTALCDNYKKLPEDLQKIPFEIISNKNFMKKGNNTSIAAAVIFECFEFIPIGPDAELLLILSNYPEAVTAVSWVTFDSFSILPKNIVEKIIENIIDYDDSIDNLSNLLLHQYPNLSIALRNKILNKVLEYNLPDYFYINMEKNYFSEIPDDLKDEILMNIPLDDDLID